MEKNKRQTHYLFVCQVLCVSIDLTISFRLKSIEETKLSFEYKKLKSNHKNANKGLKYNRRAKEE